MVAARHSPSLSRGEKFVKTRGSAGEPKIRDMYHSTLTDRMSGVPFAPVLAKELKKTRLAAGLTQEQLASKASFCDSFAESNEAE